MIKMTLTDIQEKVWPEWFKDLVKEQDKDVYPKPNKRDEDHGSRETAPQ